MGGHEVALVHQFVKLIVVGGSCHSNRLSDRHGGQGSGVVVRIGSKITVEDIELGFEETYQVVGSQEADPMNGRISEDSPFGRALIGKKAGEEVNVEAPAGTIRYKIVEIQ